LTLTEVAKLDSRSNFRYAFWFYLPIFPESFVKIGPTISDLEGGGVKITPRIPDVEENSLDILGLTPSK